MSISKLINNYKNKKRILWVINTSSKAHLYLWENWKNILPLIDSLVTLSSSQAYIRTNQALEHENQWLGFGRMVWNKANNEKWTKKFRENEYADTNVVFYNTQIWAPDWNKHCKTGIPPDIFIHLYNNSDDNIINEGIVISMPKSTFNNNVEVVESVLNSLLKVIPNSTLGQTTRTWWPNKGFPNQIQDINNWEIAKILENV